MRVPTSSLLLACGILHLVPFVSANQYQHIEARQADTTLSTSTATEPSSSSSEPPSTSTSATESSITSSPTANSATSSNTSVQSDLVTATETFTESTLPASATTVPGSSLLRCSKDRVSKEFPASHICDPKNGTERYTGNTYYVTWDTDAFDANSTVSIQLNYVNETLKDQSAFNSKTVDKNLGFIYMLIEDSMLKGEGNQFAQLFLVSNDAEKDKKAEVLPGPIVNITTTPTFHLAPPPPNSVSQTGLMIGLPLGLGIPILIVLLLCLWNRSSVRKIRSLGDLKALTSRRRGYGVGKSRRQRTGSMGPIHLQDDPMELERIRDRETVPFTSGKVQGLKMWK